MIHSEPNPSRLHWLGLALCAVLVLLLFLGSRTLSTSEAAPALAAQQALKTGKSVTVIAEALELQLYPLPAQIIQLSSGWLGNPNEWSVRLPNALAILLMGVLAAAAARRMYGSSAAAIAFAVVCLSLPGVQAARAGAGAAIPALLLTAAWFGWFFFGWQRQRWLFAWWGSLLLVLLAAMAQGYLAFLFFYLPLLFLRRPLRAWPQLATLTHSLALATSLSLFSAWYFWLNDAALPLVYTESAFGLWSAPQPYFLRLCTFPLHCAVLLIPWGFFLGPAYCAAFLRLERHTPFIQFLRTLILPIFVMAWLVPALSPGNLLPLLVPVSVLCGVHYDILVRRHKLQLQKMSRLMAVIGVAAAVVALVISGLHVSRLLMIDNWEDHAAWAGFGIVLIGAALLAIFFRTQSGLPIWLQIAASSALVSLFVIVGCWLPYTALKDHARVTGKELGREIPNAKLTYVLSTMPAPAIFFYIDQPLRRIDSPDDIATDQAVVYVVGTNRAPIQETRDWQPVSPRFSIRDYSTLRLQYNRTTGRLNTLSSQDHPPQDAASQAILRTYKGINRNL